MTASLHIILDTDPGIDDAAAIAAALFAPELDLQLITTVAGNVSVEKTTRNALQLLHFWNSDIPLAQGAATPLLRPLRDAAYVHGESGMEGYDFCRPSAPTVGEACVYRYPGCADERPGAHDISGDWAIDQYCVATDALSGVCV
ncbi:ribonucleoside hydrolase [Salmonella enterica subsp. enterica]|nr:ribonucleoside hydrolase [Salmonella enterica subsp. enterica]